MQIHFTDLMGVLRVFRVPAERFLKDDLLKKGSRFDGSSIGFRKVEKSDMIALPDPDTFLPLPHMPGEALIRANLYDVDMNPYRAGLDSIKKKISYDPIMKNIYKMTDEDIKQHGIKRLPTNLMEALEEFKQDTVLMDAIGKDGAELFIQNKT
ncbi:MAG: glutamine synthetase beta-grasp domain-containing protein [Methanobacteriota archaeon]